MSPDVVPPDAGPDAFAAELARDTTPWGAAKLRAFESLCQAFPDPDGPPDWALRQIARGQFDRRLPPAWRPVFVEVFHQWLGFSAEREESRERRAGTWRWWSEAPWPRLRRFRLGELLSPLALAIVVMSLLILRLAAIAPQLHAAATLTRGEQEGARRAAFRSWEAEQVRLDVLRKAGLPVGRLMFESDDDAERAHRAAEAAFAANAWQAESAERTLRRTRFPRWSARDPETPR